MALDTNGISEHFLLSGQPAQIARAARSPSIAADTIPPGEPIRLSLFVCVEGIEHERTPPLVVGARVQWIAEGDDSHPVIGVKFEAITDAQRGWLAKMLEVTGQ